MTDRCREAFEAWYSLYHNYTARRGAAGGYSTSIATAEWEAWQAAWKESRPVSRDGWLTEEEIDRIEDAACILPDDEGKLLSMARAAIRMHAGHKALFTQLHAAIETCERGNV